MIALYNPDYHVIQNVAERNEESLFYLIYSLNAYDMSVINAYFK